MTSLKAIDKLIILLIAVLVTALCACIFIAEVDINFKVFACSMPFLFVAIIYIDSKKQILERSLLFYIDLQDKLGNASIVLNGLTFIFLMPSLLAATSGHYLTGLVLAVYGILLSISVNLIIKKFK